MLHAHKTEPTPDTQPYRQLEQKLLSRAKDFGLEDWVQYDRRRDEYFPTREFEEASPSMGFIEEFQNDSFWDELLHRLVQRDLVRETGEEAYCNLSFEERFQREQPHEEKWQAELEAHGLDRLGVLVASPEPGNGPG